MIGPMNGSLASINLVLCNFDHSSANLFIAEIRLTQWKGCVQKHADQLLFSSWGWLIVSTQCKNDRAST
jgi:hypothetical protein